MSIFTKILLFTLLMMGFVFAQNEPAIQKSHLKFTEDSFDFGVLTTDSLVTHVFNFKNTGPDTIEIHNVGSS